MPQLLHPRSVGTGTFAGLDSISGGWTFIYKEKAGEFYDYKIPPHYAPALAVINAKIVWLQVIRAKKFKATSVSEREILGRMRDSSARSLLFTVDVRKLFLSDISNEFYDTKGEFVSRYTDKDTVFRSPTLDSWLYVEYNKGSHSPPTYYETAKASNNLRDPLKVELRGRATLPRHWRY
jgi:hypothetical protein